jgi:hypothetical protein
MRVSAIERDLIPKYISGVQLFRIILRFKYSLDMQNQLRGLSPLANCTERPPLVSEVSVNFGG